MSDVNGVYGAWLIGQLVASMFFGISVLQTWIFVQQWKHHPKQLQVLVLAVFFLGVVQIILFSHVLYTYLVYSMENSAIADKVIWSLLVEPIPNSVLAFLVTIFYASRIYLFTRNKVVSVVILTLSCTGFVIAITVNTFGFISNVPFVSPTLSIRLAVAALALYALADAAIMAAMSHFLYIRRREDGGQSMAQILQLVTAYTLACGFLTFICGVVVIGTLVRYPDKQIHRAVISAQSHIYVNSLLAVVNARVIFRERLDKRAARMGDISTMEFGYRHSKSPAKARKDNQVQLGEVTSTEAGFPSALASGSPCLEEGSHAARSRESATPNSDGGFLPERHPPPGISS